MISKPQRSCLIIDDELASRRVLQHFVNETDALTLKAVCTSANEAFTYLQNHTEIDVLFLDINMPVQSGLAFYKTLKDPPPVIFTTAYPQYAVDGFEVNAIDYLLKPIAYERFLTAINKLNIALDTALDTDTFMILKENKVLHKVFYNDVYYLEAYGDYVKVHTATKVITTHSPFYKFIEQLPLNFLRVHKSYSINLDKMTQLSGNKIALDAFSVPIGQTYKQHVLKALNL